LTSNALPRSQENEVKRSGIPRNVFEKNVLEKSLRKKFLAQKKNIKRRGYRDA